MFKIRKATINDLDAIYDLIIGIAKYEKMLDQVIATKEDLKTSLFEHKHAHVLLGEADGKVVGFALYFYSFSTFVGRANLYLEDLFVYESYRGKGYGKQLLNALAKEAVSMGCERLDWVCLDWNKPSIDFYHSIGAKRMDEWLLFRLEGDALNAFAKK